MSTELKKTASHAGIYAFGVILDRAVSFVMLPIYTRFLTPEDYGVLELLALTVDLISIVCGMGLLHGLFKFYYQYEDSRERHEVVSTIFMLIIGSYALTCGIGGLFSAPISTLVFGVPDWRLAVFVTFVNLFLSFLIYVPLAFLQARQRPVLFVVVSLVKLLLQLGLNIVFVVVLGMKVMGVLTSTLLASLVVGGALTIYTFRQVGWTFSRSKAKVFFRFGYPFILMSFATFITTFSDRYFLNYFRDVTTVGLYALSYKFGFLLMMFPVRPIFNIWMPQRFELVKKPDYEALVNRFLSWFVIVTLGAALLIAVTVRDVLRIMAAPDFWEAFRIVPVIVLAYFFQACTDFFNFGIHYSGKTKHMAYGSWLAAIVIILLSFVLIPIAGGAGAAWATLIAFFVRLAYVYVASQRLYRIRFQWFKPLTTFTAGVVVFAFHRAATAWVPVLDELRYSLPLAVLAVVVFGALLASTGVISAEERRAMLRFVRAPRRAFAAVDEPQA